MEDPYSKLTKILQEILQKHAPLKSKLVRGNHAPFMNEELSKVIMNKSRLRNKYKKIFKSEKSDWARCYSSKDFKNCKKCHDSHLTNITNRDIKENKFSEDAKTVLVRSLHKKNDQDKIQNYRPVSILNGFSKVYERYLLSSLSNCIEKMLSNFIAAYRKRYSSSHVLIRLIENWKRHLDNKKIIATVLIGLSKAFDCIPCDLLIAKLHAYGFNKRS